MLYSNDIKFKMNKVTRRVITSALFPIIYSIKYFLCRLYSFIIISSNLFILFFDTLLPFNRHIGRDFYLGLKN